MKREILRVQKLSKSNQSRRVLNDYNMNLYEGELLGIISLRDSDKSLLLNILKGKHKWDTGSIFFDEEPVTRDVLKKTKKIELINDSPTLVQTLSVLENIFIIRSHLRPKIFIRWDLLKKQLKHHFVELGINIDINRIVSTLSLAEQHLIEIMKAYILGAKVILIENIIALYTPEEHYNFHKLINILKQKNVSFIITGNQLAVLQKYADRILFIDKGTNIKVFHNLGTGELDEKRILLGDIPYEKVTPVKKQFDEIAFEACHVSINPGEDISFKINRGEISVILDLSHPTTVNLINAITGKVKYSGNFYFEGEDFHDISKLSSVYFADFEMDEVDIKNIDLKDNLCLSVFPRISRFGFISARQRKQIMNDFLKIYHERNIEYEFDLQNLSQPEAMAMYLYRILIQKWNLLLCINPEILFSYETANIIKDQLRRMTENGRTICIFASTIEPYATIADYFYIVEDGKVHGKYTYQECQQRFRSYEQDLNNNDVSLLGD